MGEYCQEFGLPIRKCGKVIVPLSNTYFPNFVAKVEYARIDCGAPKLPVVVPKYG